MRNFGNSLIFTAALLVGTQSAFASCLGTVYFKAPDTWADVYVATYMGNTVKIEKDAVTGFYIAKLETIGQNSYSNSFNIGAGTTPPIKYVSVTEWEASSSFDPNILQNNQGFACPGEGNSVYIFESPDRPGTTVVSSEPPGAKYVYFMPPPEDAAWMNSSPMISLDGGKTAKPRRCPKVS
ncbi:hypothetical protein [Fibrobacter sp. UWP2]|uniref:hypothetical protein n=1 Tax=Fibrobacter sp. UWP2 TaxID=1896216 RepID=UPI0009186406|nr:hypothetical protein [Fibrobacter sp. UWP2]SHJ54877.1 hypothetical protein SAMN05720471_1642 [Fibrobacter sp. UWP2]